MTPLRRGWRSLLTVAAVVVTVVAALGLGLAHGINGYVAKRRMFATAHWRVPHPRDARALGLSDVAFISRDGTPLRGWLIPSRTGAMVVLCDGAAADRSSMLDDARALRQAGIGVLLFDWPGQGESGGHDRFGLPAQHALEGAVDFVLTRHDVDPHRVGALGFSLGGYTLVPVAAQDRRIRAVLLAGVPADIIEQTRREYAASGWLAQRGALLALSNEGVRAGTRRPLDDVAAIAPRPIVVVAGHRDATVPASLSERLYAAAHGPKQLWIIEHAAHGGYERADPRYGQRMAAFFASALGVSGRLSRR